MRAIFISLTFVFCILSSTKSFSKDYATWGLVGSSCANALKAANLGKQGRDALGYSIQGFLTGYNTHIIMMSISGKDTTKTKVINKYSINEIVNILVGKCTQNPSKSTFIALIEIWRSFPDAN
ncbi:MAG: hypothetical protein VW229_01620 [Pelagibacteraceae bacterium]|jgi:hypothetical protein